MKYRRPLILFFVVLVLVSAGIVASMRQGALFAIRAIPLEWETRLSKGRMELEISREIESSIGTNLGAVMGRRPWEVDLPELNKTIRSLPWVESARVSRALPDRLIVSIRPKRPLAVLVDSEPGAQKSIMRPMTTDGELMPTWTSEVMPDVPFLRGDQFRNDVVLRKTAVRLIQSLPSEGILDRSNIAELSFQDGTGTNSGYSIQLISPRTAIQLGHIEREPVETLSKKLRRVGAVLNYLSVNGKRAHVIDSTSVKKVVVRAHHRP